MKYYIKEQGASTSNILDILAKQLFDDFMSLDFYGTKIDSAEMPQQAFIEINDVPHYFITYSFSSENLQELVEGIKIFTQDYWKNVQDNESVFIRKPFEIIKNDFNPRIYHFRFRAVNVEDINLCL